MCKTLYEAQFGVEIFIEFYETMLSSPVFSYVFFIDFTVVVYYCYGCPPILYPISF